MIQYRKGKTRSERREKRKRNRRKHKVDGQSVRLLAEIIARRAREAKEKEELDKQLRESS